MPKVERRPKYKDSPSGATTHSEVRGGGYDSGAFVRVDGTRRMTADWDAGDYTITSDIFDADTAFYYGGVHILSRVDTHNYLIGEDAGASLTVAGGDSNIIIGYQAGYTLDDDENVIIGYQAGYNSDESANVFVGFQAAYSATSADTSVIVGYYASFNNQTGDRNVIIGPQAAFGKAAHSHEQNVVVGDSAAFNIGTGSQNVIGGYLTAYDLHDGAHNVILGNEAFHNNADGNYNVVVGSGAGYGSNGDYSNHVFLGYQAGYSVGDGDTGNVLIGYQAGYSEAGSNKLYIENSNSATPLIYGEFDNDEVGINTGSGCAGTLHVDQASTSGAKPVLYLDQGDVDEEFIRFDGTSAADQANSISTVNGDGAVTGPKDFSASAGWAFEGMVRVNINGTDYWMPYYSADTT